MKEKWKVKFGIILAGQAVSQIGSFAVQFAVIWWLAGKTSSPFILGVSGMAAYLPAVLLSPVAGVMADRYNRKIISIASDLSMGAAALLIALILQFIDMPVWVVLVLLFVRGVGGTFQQPAIQSIIPQLVPKDRLLKANGWIQLLGAGTFILGPVIGAAMYAVLPMSLILLTDVVGAVFAGVTLAAVKIPPLEKKADRYESTVLQFKEGIKVYREDRRLLALVVSEACCMFFYAPLSSFYPLMTSSYFSLSAIFGSLVEIAFAMGMMIASVLFGSVIKIRNKLRISYAGLIGMGAAVALCGLVPPTLAGWVVFALMCMCLGAAGNVHGIPLTAYIQETVEPEKMGRAFALLSQIASFSAPVGLMISSPLAEKTGVRAWFLISGAGILISLLLVQAFMHKKNRKITEKIRNRDL
ncbi:MAG: MFS transporter [Clostridia bacterium]|nr:MFS transporter [Clostridia bacterium]